jgi:hypothetical protein
VKKSKEKELNIYPAFPIQSYTGLDKQTRDNNNSTWVVAHTCNSATQETEIRKMVVQASPDKRVCKTLYQKKKKKTQKRAGGVAQGVGPKFKPQETERE